MAFEIGDEQVAQDQKNGCDDNKHPIAQAKFREILGAGKAYRKNKIQYPYNNIQQQEYHTSGPYSYQVLIGIIIPV
jgi:hypothetical protein